MTTPLHNNIIINDILINQNLNGILPFIFYGEDKFKDVVVGQNEPQPSSTQNPATTKQEIKDATLRFKFRTTATTLDYSEIQTPLFPPPTTTGTTYVPETEESKYVYNPIFYVDLISEDKNGIDKVNVRGQVDRYNSQAPTQTFIIPKFEWLNTIGKVTPSTSLIVTPLSNALGSVWIGVSSTAEEGSNSNSSQSDGQNKVYRIDYNKTMVKNALMFFTDSETHNITFDKTISSMYLTNYDNLYKYTVDNYIGSNGAFNVVFSPSNPDKVVFNSNNVISLSQDSELWAVKSYEGKLVKLDPNTLLELASFSGVDAPFKIIKSSYHNCYFVSGTNILWKFDGISFKAIYEINGYKISDFDVSTNGEIIILLNGLTDGILRILDKNLYRILVNEELSNSQFRFSKYCDNDKFYAIAESNIGENDYSFVNYIYDINLGTTVKVNSPITIKQSEVIVTPVPTTNKVDITSPVGGEVLIIGSTVNITWKSTESVKDSIFVELYKNGVSYSTISSDAPNTGSLSWKVPDTIENGEDYTIQLIWNGVPPNSYTSTSPLSFSILDMYPSSSEVIVPVTVGAIAGIDYDPYSENVVVIMRSGYLGYFDTKINEFNGVIKLDISGNILCAAVKNEKIKTFDTITKVRIFVGTQPYLNDKWDSGEVTTTLTSMFYGGGNNLVPGETYYMNIQVYSTATGWSNTQPKLFVMPN